NFIPPSNDIEKELVEIWSEVLKLPTNVIGANTSFFELGGHSLLASLLANRISEKFKVKFELKEIFIKKSIIAQGDFIQLNNWLLNTKTNENEATEITI
ncbi:phosphopantetheine-binding protein, partial [Maribacter sp. 2307UL18-2]|uniref:phosphopantetheine-binding protein n=1 Tax=Maribacter sp. 2307UL18-2 TaxID=3386274 RepID=UPI0039BD71DF